MFDTARADAPPQMACSTFVAVSQVVVQLPLIYMQTRKWLNVLMEPLTLYYTLYTVFAFFSVFYNKGFSALHLLDIAVRNRTTANIV